MKNQWDEYQRELQHHYIIRVQTEKGPRYIFSYRAVVEHEGYAKIFNTKVSARRCMKRSPYKEYVLIEIKNKVAGETK